MCRPLQDSRPSRSRLPGRSAPPGLTLPGSFILHPGLPHPRRSCPGGKRVPGPRGSVGSQPPPRVRATPRPRPSPEGGRSMSLRGPRPRPEAPQPRSLAGPPCAGARVRPPPPAGRQLGSLKSQPPGCPAAAGSRPSAPSPEPDFPRRGGQTLSALPRASFSARAAGRKKQRMTLPTPPGGPEQVSFETQTTSATTRRKSKQDLCVRRIRRVL